MRRNNIQVPYGYEPPVKERKGTLIFYDAFERTTAEDLERAATVARQKAFERLVLYPLHEETVRRMTKDAVRSFYKREDELHDWKRGQDNADISIEGWEGKRKKYTPIDSALRYLTEKYPSPYFLYLTPEMGNQFASFSSFEEWIVKIRLLLTEEPKALHPRLEKYRHRWGLASEEAKVPPRNGTEGTSPSGE
ncbi:hypothetical protein LBW89_23770 [Paenibacillus sp. alder61]|uniref:Uncharacterized protein n=1 Tax=Paenibacillus faecis TaxID=862114 RepID=A0A5D0CMF6_9BACL|nr:MULTISPECIES: hypothetical protein [Paenibacillus]MCA1296029.1 hypothetical protein [Paenibacillus sp. alder61]TYA10852.1 hypothetical protein FRY98_24060 [Paenibacillus faecis]